MARILQHNEALGTFRVVEESCADVPGYVRRLSQSSVLEHTRSFVAWIVETPAGPDQWGRPQPGRFERVEVARGMAR